MKFRMHFLMNWVQFFALFTLILSICVLLYCGTATAESDVDVIHQTLDDKQVFESPAEEDAGELTIETAMSRGNEPDLNISMPASINIGESLTITVNTSENVTLRSVRIESNNIPLGNTAFTGNTAVVPDYRFDIGENTLTIQGIDLNTNETFKIKRFIQVLGTSPANGPAVSADKDNADFGESVSFTISMPGAERFAYQTLIYVGSEIRTVSSLNCKTADDEITVTRKSDYANSRFMLRAKAFVNGAWTAYSEYEVSINEAPKLDTPGVIIPNLLLVGKPIEIRIQSVEHAEDYNVLIYKNNTNLWGKTYSTPGTYQLDIDSIVGSYSIEVFVSAKGYENSESFWADFDIVNEIINGPEISSSKDELLVRQNATFTMTLPGATQFRSQFIVYQNGVEIYSGGNAIDDATDGSAQHIITIHEEWTGAILELHTQARINNQWTKETILRVPVEAVPRLDTPSLTVPSGPVEAGTPVYVNIGNVENAYDYFIEVEPETNPSIQYTYTLKEAGLCELQGLTEPGDYTIRAKAYTYVRDYISSLPATATVKLIGTPEEGPNLSSFPWVQPGKYINVFANLDGAERFYMTTTVCDYYGRILQIGYLPDSFSATNGTGSYSLYVGTYSWDAIYDYRIYVSAYRNGKWTLPSMIDVAVNGTDRPTLKKYDFVFPNSMITIEASAFERIDASSVYIPDSCTSIGAHAFKDNNILQLRLPRDCAIDSTSFDDCTLYAIVAPAGGISQTWAEEYISTHSDCTFYVE